MLTTLRHMLSVLLLPFMVLVVVPIWLHNAFSGISSLWGTNSFIVWLTLIAGASAMLAGLILFVWCVDLFVRVGKGTLAPWDPTRNLVAAGPYRYVRNPMIGAVGLMLFGQAVLWRSAAIGMWLIIFLVINHLYFIYMEEPGLEKRFGESYRSYKVRVPRWIPRRKP
jgi:protein-S-isoprenylcysteine O-methyltransferase Ste14